MSVFTISYELKYRNVILRADEHVFMPLFEFDVHSNSIFTTKNKIFIIYIICHTLNSTNLRHGGEPLWDAQNK